MSEIKILIFGSLADIVGNHSMLMEIRNDSDSLLNLLKEKFPLLNERKFVMSVDKKIISENTRITSSSEIALLPPFSGG